MCLFLCGLQLIINFVYIMHGSKLGRNMEERLVSLSPLILFSLYFMYLYLIYLVIMLFVKFTYNCNFLFYYYLLTFKTVLENKKILCSI